MQKNLIKSYKILKGIFPIRKIKHHIATNKKCIRVIKIAQLALKDLDPYLTITSPGWVESIIGLCYVQSQYINLPLN